MTLVPTTESPCYLTSCSGKWVDENGNSSGRISRCLKSVALIQSGNFPLTKTLMKLMHWCTVAKVPIAVASLKKSSLSLCRQKHPTPQCILLVSTKYMPDWIIFHLMACGLERSIENNNKKCWQGFTFNCQARLPFILLWNGSRLHCENLG